MTTHYGFVDDNVVFVTASDTEYAFTDLLGTLLSLNENEVQVETVGLTSLRKYPNIRELFSPVYRCEFTNNDALTLFVNQFNITVLSPVQATNKQFVMTGGYQVADWSLVGTNNRNSGNTNSVHSVENLRLAYNYTLITQGVSPDANWARAIFTAEANDGASTIAELAGITADHDPWDNKEHSEAEYSRAKENERQRQIAFDRGVAFEASCTDALIREAINHFKQESKVPRFVIEKSDLKINDNNATLDLCFHQR